MDQLIAEILPYSVAVALSPMPIVALLLILFSKNAKINSIFFWLGWILGLSVIVIVFSFLITSTAGDSTSIGGISIKSVVDGLLGLLLILFAINQLKNRPREGQPGHNPKWMSAIESFKPLQALGLGLMLAAINFKNTPMGIAVAASIGRLSTSTDNSLTALGIYLLIGGSTIILPAIGFILFRNKLERPLNALKVWLITNNAVIMFVLFLILGVSLISKAFGG